MSLYWSIVKCADPEFLRSEEQWRITTALLNTCMAVGIGKITKENAAEWYGRYSVLASLNGTPSEFRLTPLDVKRRIGVETNVFPKEPEGKWLRRIMVQKLKEERRYYTLAG